MNIAPIVPAVLAYDALGLPMSPEYGDIYHPISGALAQARHVFLAGNALPARWQGRESFVILETGFGLGNNFLATWQAWRDDPQRCERLTYLSIEKHPLTHADLAAVHRSSALGETASSLLAAWPPLTHNLHELTFDGGRVRLLLALGDVQSWLPELVAQFDACYLDGYAPAHNPRMWDERVCKALGRLAAPGATLATWSAARALRDRLTSAGFEVRRAPGQGGKRDITLASYAPRYTPRRAPARIAAKAAGGAREAVIVGGGLAGCATAWALTEHGWRSTLIERRPQIAAEASGNPAGLFHGIVNAQDGVHARFNRASALAASAAVRTAIERHGAPGRVDGLLRLETGLDVAAMRALLQRLGLPPDYVQALDARAASVAADLTLQWPAWFYPGGGWVQPAALARALLERAGARVECRHGIAVDALRRGPSGWRLLDAREQVIAEAETIVLANADDALRLLGAADWPIDRVRGQLSMLDATAALALPRLPLAGAGYLLPAVGGQAIFGATAQPDDADPAVRRADHEINLAQLERLIGRRPGIEVEALRGRTAWRCSSRDRLPVIGAVPDTNAARAAARLDQPRFVPRLPGLFIHIGLGSRGITWSALGARLLAATICGAPLPLEASLVDAVDPARYLSRQARRRAS